LHGVLDGAEEGAFFGAVTDFQGLGVVNHGLEEGLVDILVDVDALDSEANLAAVELSVSV